MIESGNVPDGLDAESYRVVFDALKKEPDFKLSSDFASKVAAMMPGTKPSFNWDRFFFVDGFISFVGAFAYAFVSISPAFSTGVFSFVSGYPGLFVFAVVFVILLNWVDKKWIAKPTNG